MSSGFKPNFGIKNNPVVDFLTSSSTMYVTVSCRILLYHFSGVQKIQDRIYNPDRISDYFFLEKNIFSSI